MHLFVIHLRLCSHSSIHISFHTFHKVVWILRLTCKPWVVWIFTDLRRRLHLTQGRAGSILDALRVIIKVYWARRINLVFFVIRLLWLLFLLLQFVYFIIWIIGWVAWLPLMSHTAVQCTLAFLWAGARCSQNVPWLTIRGHHCWLLTSGHTPFLGCLKLLLRFERMLKLHI